MSNISAAIGLGQLEVLKQRVQKRREIFNRYFQALNKDGFNFMPELQGTTSTRWLTTLTINKNKLGFSREDLRLFLLGKGIESRPLWKPMHLQPLYRSCEYFGTNFDESLFESGLCLPSGSNMSVSEQVEVIEHIKSLIC